MAKDAAKTHVTRIEIEDDIATIIFARPDKRNAMNDALVAALDDFFSHPPEGVRANTNTAVPKKRFTIRATGTVWPI